METRAEDPWLLGYYTDNEMPFPEDALDRALALEEDHYTRTAAEAWMAEQEITEADEAANDLFRAYMYECYAQICHEILRRYDPNHLRCR